MIWLHYRLSRLQLLIGLVALAVVGLALALTGPDLADQAGSENFLRQAAGSTANSFLYVATILLTYAVPALLGAFWGAPLVAREVEAGTHRLVWAQGVSRTRWLAYRLGLGAAAVLLLSGLLTLAITWWAAPIDEAVPKEGPIDVFSFYRMSPFLFGVRGVVPIGYALFAFALGVVLGLVLRRTLVALGLTMAAMVVLQVCMPLFVREHLATPIETRLAVTLDNLRGLQGSETAEGPRHETFRISGAGPADWVLEDQTVDRTGAVPTALPDYVPTCLPEPGQDDSASEPGGVRDRCIQRLAADGYQQSIVYHPESAFWMLQWRETGLLLGGTALLSGFAFWRIRRDL